MTERERLIEDLYRDVWSGFDDYFDYADFDEYEMAKILERHFEDMKNTKDWLFQFALKLYCIDKKADIEKMTDICEKELETGNADFIDIICNRLIDEIDFSEFPPENSGYYYNESKGEWDYDERCIV